jgi:hypothetical protein
MADTALGGTWSISNTNVSLSNDTITAFTAGADTVIYMVNNFCGSDTATHTVFVIPPPNAGTITGPDSVCAGATITMSETVSGTTWSMLNTLASVNIAGIVSGIAAGIDTVVFTYSNYCGLAYQMKQVVIKGLPVPGSILGSDSICVGITSTLFETSIYGFWSALNPKATVNPFIDGGLVTGVSAGTDTILYTVTNSCGSASDSLKLSVIAPLAPPVISGSSYVCVGGKLDTLVCSPTGGTWTSSNNLIATVIGDTAIGVNPGAAIISYTITNYCGSATSTDSILVFSKHQCDSMAAINYVNPINSIEEPIKVYPNPSDGNFIIELPTSGINCKILITDIYGKTIESKIIENSNNGKIPINIAYLPGGTYFIKVTTEDRTYIQKIEIW